MKKNFICSKKSVRTFKLRTEPYFLSHAERGKTFWIREFLAGMRLCRACGATPFRLPIPIFNFGGEGGIRTLDTDLTPYNRLATCRFRPLSHLSKYSLEKRAGLLLAAVAPDFTSGAEVTRAKRAKYRAEREGFEPSVPVKVLQFSRLLRSTALPPLQIAL